MGKLIVKPATYDWLKSIMQAGMWRLGYANTLGASKAIDIKGYSGQHLVSTYTVSDKLCIGKLKPYLPIGVMLGIFDEYSTVDAMMRDRTHRPGVSVTLSCEMFRKIGPGQQLKLVSKANKIGKVVRAAC